MKRLVYGFLVVCAVILHAITGHAETILSSAQNTSESISRPGFLFSIKKDGRESYIFGTIHAGFSKEQNLGDKISQIAAHSTGIFLEANLSDNPNLFQLMLSESGHSTDRASLRSIIGAEYYDFFHYLFVSKFKWLSDEEYDSSRPWFLAMLIPAADPSVERVPTVGFGTEMQLLEIARKNNTQLGELEGFKYQVDIFNSMSESEETDYFNDYVDLVQNRKLYEWTCRGIDAWTESDFLAFQKIASEMDRHAGSYTNFFTKRLLTERNKPLARKIGQEAARRSGLLFAVGSAHLVGEKSILEELRSTGFVVERR